MRNIKKYRIAAIYDTETTNIGSGNSTRAFPILFIVNDLRDVDISDYAIDNGSDDIRFYRKHKEMLDYLDDLIEYGFERNFIPIVCAYNLMFDLQPLMFDMNNKYEMRTTAQTTTSAYTVDVLLNGEPVLRFWDTFYLEMGGLKAMGEICGLPKAIGDWDYSLIRTPETPLTDLELFYAGRDTQVIPAYLNYLLQANEWLTSDMLGVKVLTKTSIVRQMARFELGNLKYRKRNGHKMSLRMSFEKTCEQEYPKTYRQYALRKACFRGGLTFTSANYASKVWHNVVSVDVTSMHHTYINGRLVPVHFRPYRTQVLQMMCERIIGTSMHDVLEKYYRPFQYAVHVKVEYTNMRIKHDSVFEKAGIGIIPESKFTLKAPNVDILPNEANKTTEEEIRRKGWRDTAIKPLFAFGKLMSADIAVLHVNEVELWNIAQVYDYDDLRVILGEATMKFATPPDYVSLQSNMLFERKQDMKRIINTYTQGEPYALEIPESIPRGIADELKKGTADMTFLNGYYNSTVKGSFNGIYGTQAMDLQKCGFKIVNGDIIIDKSTITTSENYDEMKPKTPMVLYTYGMRIVAGSRQHLVIALKLIGKAFGDLAKPTGGDTDSMKISVDATISDDMLVEALKPIADACDNAIGFAQRRNRENFPELASKLQGIGHFDVEKADSGTRWENHWEAWNKARISASNGHYHITCAGLSRPRGVYHVEHWCADMERAGYSFEEIASTVLGYNTYISHDISHSLQKYRPNVNDRYIGTVADYLGEKTKVDVPQSIALYPTGRWLGETDKTSPLSNIKWLKSHGNDIDTQEKIVTITEEFAQLLILNDYGEYVAVMQSERTRL